MTFTIAAFLTERLVAFALFLQAVEMIFVIGSPVFNSVWSYENGRGDFAAGLPLPSKVVTALFGPSGFRTIVIWQILLSVGAFVMPSWPLFTGLMLTHLIICIRFRGSFNGGSDMMTFVCLTGVLILTSASLEHTQRLGLLYIAIQAIYSYFKAGAAKLRAREWRDGSALPAFLSRSLFTDVKRIGVMLRFKPGLAGALAWFVIVFEMGALALPFIHRGVHFYFAFAVIFHLLIYRAFGLNRFFWIWLAAWPSIFYLAQAF